MTWETKSKDDMHQWSGWPGAYCLKCGAPDPMEVALADELIAVSDEEWKWLGTKEEREALVEADICPVKGRLIWNNDIKKFELRTP